MRGADILVECLKKQGVEVIFGVPGSPTREIYAALNKNRQTIHHITSRHEGGASFMANGYARISGKVGVCLTIPGPGASNAYTGILEAYTNSVPLLLITAQNESYYLRKDPAKMMHGLDQLAAFSPVTKYMQSVERVEEIPEAVHNIFGALRSGRPKPALLQIARDALKAEANLKIPDRNNGVRLRATDKQIEGIIDLLSRSTRPFILAGGGVFHSGASAELKEFAELIHAPVATTAMGKGAISESENLSLGYIGDRPARAAMADADLVFAIGTRFVQMDTDGWSLKIPGSLIHIEADSEEIGKEYTPKVGIGADSKLVLRQLLHAIKKIKPSENFIDWENIINKLKRDTKRERGSRYLRQLREVMDSDAILSVDVHWEGFSACSAFEVYHANTFLHSPISVTMGYALPVAIGAKVACPNRKVVVFCGDGGFMASSPELATAMKYALNIVVILINDNAFGTIKDVQRRHFGDTLGVDLHNPDFVKFAQSFGAYGLKVKAPHQFKSTIRKALGLDKPVVVEVIPKRTIQGRIYHTLKSIRKSRFWGD